MDGDVSTEALKAKQRNDIRLELTVREGGGRAGTRAQRQSPMM